MLCFQFVGAEEANMFRFICVSQRCSEYMMWLI